MAKVPTRVENIDLNKLSHAPRGINKRRTVIERL